MNNTKSNIRKSHTCYILTKCHAFSSLWCIIHSATKVFRNNFYSFYMKHVTKFPCTSRYVTLNRMCECIHTCRCCKSLWHWSHHIWVNNCHNRNIVNINTNHLSVLICIGDYIVNCNLSRCTCCSRNCNNRHCLFLCWCNPFKWTNICKLWIFYHDTNRFSGINGRTSADCNDAVSPTLFKCLHTCLDIFNRRIRLYVTIQFIRNRCFI